MKRTVSPYEDGPTGTVALLGTDPTCPAVAEWECYLGQAAVDEQIIGRGFLGAYSSGPGVG